MSDLLTEIAQSEGLLSIYPLEFRQISLLLNLKSKQRLALHMFVRRFSFWLNEVVC